MQKLLKIEELAERLEVEKSWIYTKTRKKEIPFRKLGKYVRFDPIEIKVADLIEYLFEVIDPYSVDKQGPDSGRKYRTGVYSCDSAHLDAARNYIAARHDAAQIALEIAPLTNYLKSATEHQDRLTLHPNTPCHIPREILHKYHKIK